MTIQQSPQTEPFPTAEARVELINLTVNAQATLAFTKNTRLNMTPNAWMEMLQKTAGEFNEELEYMANTIPSSWEFVDYIFLITGVSRAYTHQQVRTRAASYAQQSMRVTNQGEYRFVMPDRLKRDEAARAIVDRANYAIRAAYRELTEMGVAAEDARSILPTNIATNIVAKFNLRTLSEIVQSRSGGRTQSEYQTVVRKMADAVLVVHPWASKFLFPKPRDYFDEIERFAEAKFSGDLLAKGELLKIVDKMRKAR